MRAWGDGVRQGLGQLASRREERSCPRRGRGLSSSLGVSGIFFLLVPTTAAAAPVEPLYVAGIPVDFILFALTLLGRRAVPPPHAARSR